MNDIVLSQTVIFLNGVSSSGKTTIAKILQNMLPAPYLHVQLDAFEEVLLGTAARQFEHVHCDGIYDVEGDTSLATPQDCARQVIAYITGHEPTAFHKLRVKS